MSAETIPVQERSAEQREAQREKNRGAIELLQQWRLEEGDPHNDAEVWEQVKAGLDEARGSGRKLFND